MMKWIRYLLIAFFWVFGAGSLVEGKYLYGVVGLIFMATSVAYAEFSKRNVEKFYWAIVWIGLAVVLTMLYFEDVDA